MKFIKLLTAAYVSGVLRHPHEGSIPVDDKEAAKLVKDVVAEDVTDGFSAAQIKDAIAESVTADSGRVPTPASPNPHQAEVETDTPTQPQGRKAAERKE